MKLYNNFKILKIIAVKNTIFYVPLKPKYDCLVYMYSFETQPTLSMTINVPV
jgi:hypothetical protein